MFCARSKPKKKNKTKTYNKEICRVSYSFPSINYGAIRKLLWKQRWRNFVEYNYKKYKCRMNFLVHFVIYGMTRDVLKVLKIARAVGTRANKSRNALAFIRFPTGLSHTAAMLSPEGLQTFVFAHRNSFPNISTRGTKSIVYGQYGSHASHRLGRCNDTTRPLVPLQSV